MLSVSGGQKPASNTGLKASRRQAERLTGTETEFLFIGGIEIIVRLGGVMFSITIRPLFIWTTNEGEGAKLRGNPTN